MAESPLQHLDLLRRVPYFAGLTNEVLGALVGVAGSRHYARGQLIFLEGDPCAGLFIVAAGEVKIFKLSPQGREQIIHQLGPGGTFNDVAVLDGGPNPASAAATADSTLCIIGRERHSPPGVRLSAARLGADREHRAAGAPPGERGRGSVSAVGQGTAGQLLLAEAERVSGQAAIDRGQMMTQAEMAARLGTVREMIGRALRDLADEGLIEFDRHRIVITDRSGLQAVSDSG